MIDSRTELLLKIGGIVREMSTDEIYADRIVLGEWNKIEDILPDNLYVPNCWGRWTTVHSFFIRPVRPGEMIVELEINKNLKIAVSGDYPVVITDSACELIGHKPAKSFKLGDFIPVANRVISPGLPGDVNSEESSQNNKNISSNKFRDFYHAKQLSWISKTIVSGEGAEEHFKNGEKPNLEPLSRVRRLISGEVPMLVNFRLERSERYRTAQGFLVRSM